MNEPPQHSLLRRQILRVFEDVGLPPGIEAFIEVIDEAYRQFDDDRLMLERSLDLSSDELFAANFELRALFQALPDLVLRVASDGTILDVKAGYDEDLYRDADFLEGKRFQEAPFESDCGDVEGLISEVVVDGKVRSLAYTLDIRDEKKFYEARVLPFLGNQALIVVRDLTEREHALAELREAKALLELRVAERTAGLRDANEALREEMAEREAAEGRRIRLEKKLLQTQKLESLGVLAGGIAHDFNNFLMAILGNASLALESLPAGHPVRRQLEEIEAASQRASGLTEQMLAYSGKRSIVLERVDISSVTQSMAHLLEVSVSKKAKLVYDLASNLPLVEANSTQVGQVVMNLITNGSEAVGDIGGVVTLRTGVIEADRDYLGDCLLGEHVEEGTFVFIEVSDNGEGMDEETVAKIFDPFLTTKFTGRGLGLAAVLGIVKGHRGAIRVASAPGKGTRFTVLLPAADGRGGGKSVEADEEGPPSKGTVLVIDDDAAVRRVIGAAVEGAGYRAVVAEDGRDGLAVYRRHLDDVVCIVLDMTMPVMDGRQAFEEIRTLSQTVPVILMSGYSSEQAARSFEDRAFMAFLQKPFLPRDLLDRIAEISSTATGHTSLVD